ncbi:ankyrin repeat domain-containing protein [Sphingobium fluviale]|uniref:Ankyrin repeat domain-containing protein n=1 Tax=Sphingobium fluviale TaxID=2506423 RepID=A0A4Q1KEL2_9SPHN|nr:ankyrin repeat domain-containing protein [Sphingobium fluviale]RXR25949.1 ankyrin repeat domain-containing protein [Sphingobium fluviale]
MATKLAPFALRNIFLAVLVSLLIWPALAQAQFSDSYNFLKAVRDQDGGKVMEYLGKPGSTIINTRDVSTNQTALHIVTARRDLGWIEFLLAKGANPNLTDGGGATPLMIAAQLRFAEGAQALLDKGAQVDKANSSGETPLIRAVHLNDVALVRLLVSKGANPDKKDLMAGLSAREYAVRDGRSPAILDIFKSAQPRKSPSGAVQGPSF